MEVGELPLREHSLIFREVVPVVERSVTPKWHVEPATGVETTKPVVPGPVQVVKEAGRLGRVSLAVFQKCIEAVARAIVATLGFVEFPGNDQALLQPRVEVD